MALFIKKDDYARGLKHVSVFVYAPLEMYLEFAVFISKVTTKPLHDCTMF